jgi:uncharacterized membrane protein YkoI
MNTTMHRAMSLAVLIIASGAPVARLAAQQPAAAYQRKVPAKLLAHAKMTEDSARAVALARVPHATIKEVELEQEHGSLIWSFDLTVAGKPGIEEVNVNARTGKIVSVEHEAK